MINILNKYSFICVFHQVPDYWKAYMEDVDEERQMWINSFYKAPLRLPMPAELEYWWENGITLINLWMDIFI